MTELGLFMLALPFALIGIATLVVAVISLLVSPLWLVAWLAETFTRK